MTESEKWGARAPMADPAARGHWLLLQPEAAALVGVLEEGWKVFLDTGVFAGNAPDYVVVELDEHVSVCAQGYWPDAVQRLVPVLERLR